MLRERGNHNKPQETKLAIIEYVLSRLAAGSRSAGVASEPELRVYLKEKLNISETKNIKIHLEDLKKRGCFRKKSTPGLPNYWIIDDITHIQKIIDFFGSTASILSILNKSEIVINLIRDSVLGKERIQDLELPFDQSNFHFYFRIIPKWFKLSPSFFEFCLNNDKNILENRWEEFIFLTAGGIAFKERRIRFKGENDHDFFEQNLFEIMEIIFEQFVRNDVLYGRSNPEAAEEIRQKKKERIEVSKASNEFNMQKHNRDILNSIYHQTLFETSCAINDIILDEWKPYQEFIKKQDQRGKIRHMPFGFMEEDGKISLMSNDEKKEYFKKLGVPITEKLVKKYNIT